MRASPTVLLLAILLASARCLTAQEATDAERLYLDARHSDDHMTQLLAERWYGLVKLQEWNDATGKFSVSAKYVSHDPGMKWVKLRAIKGTGPARVVQDLTIPLERLDKRGQSRVKQIERLKPKVEESLAASAKKKKEKESNNQQPVRGMDDPSMAEPASEPPADPPAEQPTAASTPPRLAAATDPPPLNTPELPESPAAPPADEPWRTSYDTFRSNITVQALGNEEFQVDWGPMHALKKAYEAQLNTVGQDEVGPKEAEAMGKQLLEVGELQWEATLTDAEVVEGDLTPLFSLPPLPEPLDLEFAVSTQWTGDSYENFQPGERVRFIAQITEIDAPYSMVAIVRAMERVPAAAPPAANPGAGPREPRGVQ